ncbi:MAG TPA: nitronate monooxygenase [Bryobacteraceae bacterium]|nr:nitronate monooxygenase [Bryobacteraceae bacterium]
MLAGKLGLENPIFLAPMGGGPGTPELAAAVSNAGGLGALAVSYLTPDEITRTIRATRALTSKPINVNLFAGGYATSVDVPPEPVMDVMRAVHRELGLSEPVLPKLAPGPFPDQFEAVLAERPEVFSFTFGMPGRDMIRRMHEHGITVVGTATTVVEARTMMEAGMDAIAAQGAEAGAHRGTFIGSFEEAMVPTLELVRAIASFATVIASGGIMDRTDVRQMLANGAAAVQMGTAFLPCPESGASESWKQALLSAGSDTTVITRAFSGRAARGLQNEFIKRMTGIEPLPFPVQNTLTRTMRSAAAKLGKAGFQSLWAGQGVARCRAVPAAELVRSLL